MGDDFWNIQNIVPGGKRPPAVVPPVPLLPSEPAAPLVPTPPPSVKMTERDASTTALVYEPDWTPAIRTVKIGYWPSKYSFYEQFHRLAVDLFGYCAGEADYTPFFSFMPQYQQLTSSQLRYYGWWRENLRQERYLKTDDCYLLLYIYECINLPEQLPPEEGAIALAKLWAHYRAEFPKLDKYLSEWMVDYCLIHRQPCPLAYLQGFLPQILPKTTLKEFYLPEPTDILSLSAAYSYRNSKYRTAENAELFDRHIPAAMTAFLAAVHEQDSRFESLLAATPATAVRDSFVGAVCAYRNKRRIEVRYDQRNGSPSLAPILTDVVKHCENRVRTAIGVKAKFRLSHLPPALMGILDGYFRVHLPEAFAAREGSPVVLADGTILPEVNEAAYEPLEKGFSIAHAEQIEEESRKTARLLGEVYAGEAEETPPPEPHCAEKPKNEKEEAVLSRALAMLLTGEEAGLRMLAEAEGILLPVLLERVNDAALEHLGDIVCEEQRDGWHLIEEYREDVIQWMNALSEAKQVN